MKDWNDVRILTVIRILNLLGNGGVCFPDQIALLLLIRM